MSSKVSKKAPSSGPKVAEPIVTRTKSTQQRRQLRKKVKKTEKPKPTKPESKSPKSKKSVICLKDALLKRQEETSIEIVDQVEYYPNKLKRDISSKKIMLKPKHNFKIIAATNKRKMATPKKGLKSPPPKSLKACKSLLKTSGLKARSSSDFSMQDLVRMMEENRSLSDEDFMEILTCPSPVWWEDPPDGRYQEDAIYSSPQEQPKAPREETAIITISPEPIKRPAKAANKRKNKTTTKINNKQTFKTERKKKDEKYDKKKLKLENILGNIKNNTAKHEKNGKSEEVAKKRKVSESTEGDISDLSFNEEEILKNLEAMEIPIEKKADEQTAVDIKIESDLKIKKELIEKENLAMVDKKLPSCTRPEIIDEISIKSSVSDIDSIPDSNVLTSDVSLDETRMNKNNKTDEIVNIDSCTNSSLGFNDDSGSVIGVDCSPNNDIVNKSSINQDINTKDANSCQNETIPFKKIITDLTEYITVYKIIPEKGKIGNNVENMAKPVENINKTKIDTVRGKLNDFFKHCKSNKRLKKNENPIPAIPVKDVKEESIDNEKENGEIKTTIHDENRLKRCDCSEKTDNEAVFSCEECEILPCDLCNYVADTKELYKKHVSNCKDVERIPWSNNYVLNQT